MARRRRRWARDRGPRCSAPERRWHAGHDRGRGAASSGRIRGRRAAARPPRSGAMAPSLTALAWERRSRHSARRRSMTRRSRCCRAVWLRRRSAAGGRGREGRGVGRGHAGVAGGAARDARRDRLRCPGGSRFRGHREPRLPHAGRGSGAARRVWPAGAVSAWPAQGLKNHAAFKRSSARRRASRACCPHRGRTRCGADCRTPQSPSRCRGPGTIASEAITTLPCTTRRRRAPPACRAPRRSTCW